MLHFGADLHVGNSVSEIGTPSYSATIFKHEFYFSAMMNILIGICVANIKDILQQKEDFKLAKMISNALAIEEAVCTLAKWFKCCAPMSEKIVKLGSLLHNDKKEFQYKVYPVSSTLNLKQNILPLRFGNPMAIEDMEVFQMQSEDGRAEEEKETPTASEKKTYYVLPGRKICII